MPSWHDSTTRDFMNALSDLVEKYNKHLHETNGTDQRNVHKQQQLIIEAIEKILPTDNS